MIEIDQFGVENRRSGHGFAVDWWRVRVGKDRG